MFLTISKDIFLRRLLILNIIPEGIISFQQVANIGSWQGMADVGNLNKPQ